jgi:hypothetical protein
MRHFAIKLAALPGRPGAQSAADILITGFALLTGPSAVSYYTEPLRLNHPSCSRQNNAYNKKL